MFTEDLSLFFSPTEFADNAMLDGLLVQGIFERKYAEAGAGMGMSSTVPAYTLASADVPLDPIGKLLVIDGVTYAIAAHEPDGTGISLLLLERTA